LTIIEQGPLRPPSEANSLLMRLFRSCPWNKCTFCHAYGDEKFEIRPIEDIIQEIANIKAIEKDALEITKGEELSKLSPLGWNKVQGYIVSKYGYQGASMLAWLSFKDKNVFLQDADGLIGKTDYLLEVLDMINSNFKVNRITTYGRARSILHKSSEELKQLYEAGLNRIHMGLESGSDAVLALSNKGVNSEENIKAAKMIKDSGMELCIYIILGLGGVRYSDENAIETGKAIGFINPDHVRVHTLAIHDDMPIYHDFKGGKFEMVSEDQAVRELKMMFLNLDDYNGEIICTHPLNLLTEINGNWPEDKERLLGIIDEYLNMSDADRLNFQLGRRMMVYQRIFDMNYNDRYQKVDSMIKRIGTVDGVVEILRELQKGCN